MFLCSKQVGIGLQNRNKTVLWLLSLILIICLSLTGCANTPVDNVLDGPETPESVTINGKLVTAPVEILYTVKNPLEITSEEFTEGTDEEEGIHVRHEIISISGLADKGVEEAINGRIREAYEKLKSSELPPFRGIKAAIPENALRVEDYIYIAETANFNNVLSVWFNRSTTFALPGGQGDYLRDSSGFYHNTKYVSVQDALSFDLNTGKEITLADVFADNADYLALLNDAVSRELNASSAQDEGFFIHWYGMKLTESFKGLSSDQKFYLRPYGISLIFDYNTPEFYLPDFMAQTIEVSYEELNQSIAITERFYEEGENIFLSEDPPAKELMSSDYFGVPIKKQEYKDGGVNVYNYVQTSSQFPELLMENVMKLSILPQEKIDEIKRVIKEDGVNWSGELSGYFEQRVSTATIGRYATTTKHTNGGARDYWFFTLEYHTYDLKTGRELALSEMFLPGFDYMTLVRKGFEKAVSDGGGLYRDGDKLSPEESEQELNEMLSGTLEFCLNSNAIWILVGNVEFAGLRHEPLSINLFFEEIGSDNLAVFEDH